MNVYVVMSGNFTPNQRQIIKSRCQVDIGHFQRIYTWLRENNPIYSGKNLDADKENGLSGECDFIISRGEQTFTIVHA